MTAISALCLLFASDASATHYRGAAASYTIASNGVVTITAYTAWRTGSGVSEVVGFRFYTGSSASGTLLGTATQNAGATINPFTSGTELGGSLYFVKKEVFTFSLNGQANGIYYAWWQSGGWVAGIKNAVDQNNWSVQLKIAYTAGVASSGPTMLPATIDLIGRGYAYTQNLNSIDPDGTPVTYTNLTGSSAPHYAPTSVIPGLSVSFVGGISIPGGSGAGTTAALLLGRYGYKIEVTDGSGGSALRDVLVVVEDPVGGQVNQPPVLSSIGPKTVNVNANLNFVVSGTDPDSAQTLTTRAQLLPNGASYPQISGPASGTSSTFSWTPPPGSEGTYYVNFEVYDSAAVTLIDSELVTITVTGGNNPPVLTPVGNKSVANGGTLTFNLAATDPDGNSITYQMFNGPLGATLSSGGAFSWSPTAGQNNSTFPGVTLRATDNGVPNLFSQESITITVGAGNNPPVTSTTSLSVTGNVGQNLSFLVTGTDADAAQTLSLTANAGLPAGATFAGASGVSPVSSTFSWTPTLAQAGVTTVKFLTQDNGTPVLNHEITVTITVSAGVTAEIIPSSQLAPNSTGSGNVGLLDTIRSGEVISSNGTTAFRANLLVGSGTPPVDGTNFQGIWKSSNGFLINTRLAARIGEDAPDSGTAPDFAKYLMLPFNPVLSADGKLSFVGFMKTGPGIGAIPVTGSNDSAIWSEVGSTTLRMVLREGDTLAGIGTIALLPRSASLSSSTGGHLAFNVTLTDGTTAILRATNTGGTISIELVAKEGATAPGTSTPFNVLNGNSADPRMSNDGDVAFLGTLNTGVNPVGIWFKPVGGALSAIANAGGAAPGLGENWTWFEQPSLSNSSVAFRAFTATRQCIFKGDPATPASLACIAKTGDTTIIGTPGGSSLYSLWSPFSNAGGRVAFRATLFNGSAESRCVVTDADGTLKIIANAGDSAPGLAGQTFVNFEHPLIGDGNQAAFLAATNTGAYGLWRQAAGGGALSLVMKVGDSVSTLTGNREIAAMSINGMTSPDRKYEHGAMDATGRLIVHLTFTDGTTAEQVTAP